MRNAESTFRVLKSLWREFLPLSLTDVTMACGDPLVTTTISHSPDARTHLAALGVAKPLVVFFESPVIMLLHASNALSGSRASSRALWRFTLLLIVILTVGLGILGLKPVFFWLVPLLYGGKGDWLAGAQVLLVLFVLWPAASGWRRYFQGLLIRKNRGDLVARMSVFRLALMIVVLGTGYRLGLSGLRVAGVGMISGILFEAMAVTAAALMCGATELDREDEEPLGLPVSVASVSRFYWPLAASMIWLWGGRALLTTVISHAPEGAIALAAWPAAWGIVVLAGNSTRMVQQVVIRNRGVVPDGNLVTFAVTVGVAASLLLLPLAVGPVASRFLRFFVGNDELLVASVRPVLTLCLPVPFLVALQNGLQGFLIRDGNTAPVQLGAAVGVMMLLTTAWIAMESGLSGTFAASLGTSLSLVAETTYLATHLTGIVRFDGSYESARAPTAVVASAARSDEAL